MHIKIASLKVKFKEMEEIKDSYCVEEGEKLQRDTGDHFGGRNQKKYKGDN